MVRLALEKYRGLKKAALTFFEILLRCLLNFRKNNVISKLFYFQLAKRRHKSPHLYKNCLIRLVEEKIKSSNSN